MRYLIAMVSAAVFAGLATLFLSSPLASWAVSQTTFDNPDSVSDLHALVFMSTNVAALAGGWVLGWAVGGWLTPGKPGQSRRADGSGAPADEA